MLASGGDGCHHAVAGGLAPADDAADDHRLAGDEAADGNRRALAIGDAIADVPHVVFVRAHVGGRHVDFGPDVPPHAAGERTDEHLLLGRLELGRIVADSRLAAAERHADQRRLPRHLHRQPRHLVQADGRRHANAALGRPEDVVVPHQEHRRVQHLAVGDLRMNRQCESAPSARRFDGSHPRPGSAVVRSVRRSTAPFSGWCRNS